MEIDTLMSYGPSNAKNLEPRVGTSNLLDLCRGPPTASIPRITLKESSISNWLLSLLLVGKKKPVWDWHAIGHKMGHGNDTFGRSNTDGKSSQPFSLHLKVKSSSVEWKRKQTKNLEKNSVFLDGFFYIYGTLGSISWQDFKRKSRVSERKNWVIFQVWQCTVGSAAEIPSTRLIFSRSRTGKFSSCQLSTKGSSSLLLSQHHLQAWKKISPPPQILQPTKTFHHRKLI